MEFISNITKQDIETLVEGLVDEATYALARKAECKVSVSIDDETFDPTIYVVTDDRLVSVRVETEILTDNGSDAGWAFVPRLGTMQSSSILNDASDVSDMMDKYTRWLAIATLCKAIAQLEIYPYKYYD